MNKSSIKPYYAEYKIELDGYGVFLGKSAEDVRDQLRRYLETFRTKIDGDENVYVSVTVHDSK